RWAAVLDPRAPVDGIELVVFARGNVLGRSPDAAVRSHLGLGVVTPPGHAWTARRHVRQTLRSQRAQPAEAILGGRSSLGNVDGRSLVGLQPVKPRPGHAGEVVDPGQGHIEHGYTVSPRSDGAEEHVAVGDVDVAVADSLCPQYTVAQ